MTTPQPETYLDQPPALDEFKELTDTGKFRAVTAWQQRADAAEAKLRQVESAFRRHAAPFIDFMIELMGAGFVTERGIKFDERTKK